MRLWWEVARRGFRRYATYRGATFAGVFTNTVFGFIRAYVLIALFAVAPHIAGFHVSEAVTYTFVSQGMLMPLYLWGWQEIADTVYSGQIATDLYRPFDYQSYWLAQDLGRATYHGIFRGVPPFIIGAIFFTLRVPHDPWTWLFFALSFYLAVAVSFAMRFMVNLSSFWLLDVRGVHGVAAAAWTLLSGFTIPLQFFPLLAKRALDVLPFRAMFELPLNIFLERVHGFGVVSTLALQLFWVVVLLGCGRVMLRAATRKLVLQGG